MPNDSDKEPADQQGDADQRRDLPEWLVKAIADQQRLREQVARDMRPRIDELTRQLKPYTDQLNEMARSLQPHLADIARMQRETEPFRKAQEEFKRQYESSIEPHIKDLQASIDRIRNSQVFPVTPEDVVTPAMTPNVDAARVAELEGRIADLERRIAHLEGSND